MFSYCVAKGSFGESTYKDVLQSSPEQVQMFNPYATPKPAWSPAEQLRREREYALTHVTLQEPSPVALINASQRVPASSDGVSTLTAPTPSTRAAIRWTPILMAGAVAVLLLVVGRK